MTQLLEAPVKAPKPETGGGYLIRMFRATEEVNRQAVLDALPAGRRGSLLDIGTHRGDFTMRVAERTAADEVHGVEFLPEHADVARSRGVDVVEADVEEGLPYEDESFDVVCANQVIEHVRGTDLFLTEVRRVLKPEGIACISTNNLSSWHNIVALALGFQPNPMHVSDEVIVGSPLNPERGWPHEDRGRVHVRLFTARALVELARHHGLDRTGMRSVGYYPFGPRLARIAARIDPLHGAFLVGTFARA
jgi:SAM-dependent methyltransferase